MPLYRNLGYAVIAVWLASFATMLTLMWDKAWMETDPPSEVIVGVSHWAAVVVGTGLGLALLVPRVRRPLSAVQKSSHGAAFVLAMVSLSRML
jgi:hypothetical protein